MMFFKFKVIILILLSCFFIQADSSSLDDRLWEAVENQDLKLVKKLLKEGANPNAQKELPLLYNNEIISKMTPLHYVQDIKIVKALLKAKADPDAINSKGETPLHHSAKNVEKVKALLKAKADPNITDGWGETLLHSYYVLEPETIKALLKAGANPNIASMMDGYTPLHLYDDPETIEFLLKAKVKANPNARDARGRTPLHIHRNPETIEALLKAEKIKVDARDRDGETPLHIHENPEIIEALLNAAYPDAKKVVNLRNHRGETPLHLVRNMDAAIMLLDAGADPNAEDEKGRTATFSNRHVRLALRERKRIASSDDTYSCEYTSGYRSKIKPTQCGQKNLCMAEISCKIEIGGSHVDKTYQVVCSALANGNCPPATQCALDRSVTEGDWQTDVGAAASSSSSSQSSKGVR